MKKLLLAILILFSLVGVGVSAYYFGSVKSSTTTDELVPTIGFNSASDTNK